MSQENQDYANLFSPQVDMGDATKKSAEDYQVGADKGKGGVYQSIIRFVPWHNNRSKKDDVQSINQFKKSGFPGS